MQLHCAVAQKGMQGSLFNDQMTCESLVAQEAAAAAYIQTTASPWPLMRGLSGGKWSEAAEYATERVRRVSALVAARSDAEFLAGEVLSPA